MAVQGTCKSGAPTYYVGYVSGDTGHDTYTVTGGSSAWLYTRVGEDDSSIFAPSLRMRATLHSPPGANYDLFLHTVSSGCSSSTAQSTKTTGDDVAGTVKADATFGDDDYYVVFEVRYVSGDCAPGAKWSLDIEGNR